LVHPFYFLLCSPICPPLQVCPFLEPCWLLFVLLLLLCGFFLVSIWAKSSVRRSLCFLLASYWLLPWLTL
jgi:hypothetical protein